MTRNREEISTLEATRYEVVFIRGTQVLEVLGYTPRKSKTGLLKMVKHDLTHHLTTEEDTAIDTFVPVYTAKPYPSLELAPNLFIKFTGRTERTCAQ